MATINATVTRNGDNSVVKFVWANLGQGDDVSPIPFEFAAWADRTIQIEGNFSGTATLEWEGSNDGGSNYHLLTDPQGNDLTKGAADLEQIMEVTELQRPRVGAGDGSTDLTVSVVVRRPQQLRV